MNDFMDAFPSGSFVTDVLDLPEPSTSILAQACAGLRAENERQRDELASLRAVNNRLVHDVERAHHVKVWPLHVRCDRCPRSAVAFDPVPADEAAIATVLRALGWRIVGGEHVCTRCGK